jgi:hypothetical protein
VSSAEIPGKNRDQAEAVRRKLEEDKANTEGQFQNFRTGVLALWLLSNSKRIFLKHFSNSLYFHLVALVEILLYVLFRYSPADPFHLYGEVLFCAICSTIGIRFIGSILYLVNELTWGLFSRSSDQVIYPPDRPQQKQQKPQAVRSKSSRKANAAYP